MHRSTSAAVHYSNCCYSCCCCNDTEYAFASKHYAHLVNCKFSFCIDWIPTYWPLAGCHFLQKLIMEICRGQHPFGLSRRPYIRIRFARLSWIQEQIHGPMSAAKMGCNKTLKSAPCSISIVLIKKLFSQLVLCHMLIAAQRSRARMAAPLFFCIQPTTATLISFGSVARD